MIMKKGCNLAVNHPRGDRCDPGEEKKHGTSQRPSMGAWTRERVFGTGVENRISLRKRCTGRGGENLRRPPQKGKALRPALRNAEGKAGQSRKGFDCSRKGTYFQESVRETRGKRGSRGSVRLGLYELKKEVPWGGEEQKAGEEAHWSLVLPAGSARSFGKGNTVS